MPCIVFTKADAPFARGALRVPLRFDTLTAVKRPQSAWCGACLLYTSFARKRGVFLVLSERHEGVAAIGDAEPYVSGEGVDIFAADG